MTDNPVVERVDVLRIFHRQAKRLKIPGLEERAEQSDFSEAFMKEAVKKTVQIRKALE